MTQPLSIKKNENAFYSLRKEAIECIQELSGNLWTDYNLHDPGITILEQALYALTDIISRTRFGVKDYLANENNEISYNYNALYKPQDILPCSPVTINDYKKIILDEIDEIESVEIKPLKQNFSGLYDFHIRLKDELYSSWFNLDDIKLIVIGKLKKVYLKNRNLCEDLNKIHIHSPNKVTIQADISVNSKRSPSSILSEIYGNLCRYFSKNLEFEHYGKALEKYGLDLEKIYTGPLIKKGYLKDGDLKNSFFEPDRADILSLISKIEGVENIEGLSVFYDKPAENKEFSGYLFMIPKKKEDIKINLYLRGNRQDINITMFNLEYQKQFFEKNYNSLSSLDKIFQLPFGKYINFSEYSLIENDFPALYGVGKNGSASSLRSYLYLKSKNKLSSLGYNNNEIEKFINVYSEAGVKQLKAYLYFFDQILFNYCMETENLKKLFSTDSDISSTYFNSPVKLDTEYFEGSISDAAEKIFEINAKYDDFYDRRNRVLDYLLSLYGEKYSQKALKNFTDEATQIEEDQNKFLHYKIHFLKNIVKISKDRFLGFNYLDEDINNIARDNVSGLQLKVSCLLGFEYMSGKKKKVFDNPERFYLIENILLRNILKNALKDFEFYNNRISVVAPLDIGRFSLKSFRDLFEETLNINCPAHIKPSFYWMTFPVFKAFTKIYKKWLYEKSKSDLDLSYLDKLSEKIKDILINLKDYETR